MARTIITDLPVDKKISKEEMKHLTGGKGADFLAQKKIQMAKVTTGLTNTAKPTMKAINKLSQLRTGFGAKMDKDREMAVQTWGMYGKG